MGYSHGVAKSDSIEQLTLSSLGYLKISTGPTSPYLCHCLPLTGMTPVQPSRPGCLLSGTSADSEEIHKYPSFLLIGSFNTLSSLNSAFKPSQ